MNKISAIVFIKTHSERIPNKNFKLFSGEPLYTIILNRLSKIELIDEILVNTDSPEVFEFVNKLNKGVPINRPNHLLGSYINANELINHDIEMSKNQHFFQTHCTNPLLTEKTINKAILTYFDKKNEYDSLYSVTKIQNRVLDYQGMPINHKKGEVSRTQDLKHIFEENASFFIFSKNSFKKSNDRIGLAPLLYEISEIEGIDIDYENDFILAELINENKIKFPKIFN